jgi:hypothetical protein
LHVRTELWVEVGVAIAAVARISPALDVEPFVRVIDQRAVGR